MKKVLMVNTVNLNENLPAIVTLAEDGSQQLSNEVVICDKQGVEVARMTGIAAGRDRIGGARVWVETELQVVLIG